VNSLRFFDGFWFSLGGGEIKDGSLAEQKGCKKWNGTRQWKIMNMEKVNGTWDKMVITLLSVHIQRWMVRP